jgi:type II secretory pathway pseudopilin PulG
MGADRTHEAGVSLIEALLMVAVLGIVAALALDVAQNGANRAMSLATLSVGRASAAAASDHFQRIVDNSAGPEAVRQGDAARVVIETVVSGPGRCRAWPASDRLELRVLREPGGVRLTCAGPRGEDTLARWENATAQFAYSADGRAWRDTWEMAGRPYVRLVLRDGRGERSWVARPGEQPPQGPAQ